MIFILDNYDSFTFNLYQYFSEIGEKVIVHRRDECSLEDIVELAPDLIVISPGPCAPKDAPLSLSAIDYFKGKIPILGVCLGHQAIGEVFGAEVIKAKTPVHGKVSSITHDGKGVFENLPNPLTVTRYHSLALNRTTLPDELLITAETKDGEIMGVRHRVLPMEGVQFHPEAILTEAGHALLQNAVNQARAWKKEQLKLNSPWQIRSFNSDQSPVKFLESFQQSTLPFFLDSGKAYGEFGRYSFLGADPFLQASAYHDSVELYWPDLQKSEHISLIVDDQDVKPKQGSLAVLDTLLQKFKLENQTPFPFAGGAVGFFSYDLKDELEQLASQAEDDLNLPLWRLAWYDGILIYDHHTSEYHFVACGMTEDGQCCPEVAKTRLDRLEEIIKNVTQNTNTYEKTKGSPIPGDKITSVHSYVSKDTYLSNLQTVIDYIYAGDIYQANLTQRFSFPYSEDALTLYQTLHEHNPAPFAAFLPYEDFQILSSSPERLIRIDSEGNIETRPIKGTRPRGGTPEEDQLLAEDLQNSAKDRAELTMIIDLERNDLGRICKIGSVRVKDLIQLEKYPTVWHQVSTICGNLKPGLRASEILKAIYPGGSITGAPKIRAMEIIEELEPYKRGIYTGSIGYLGFDGAWDLNIVIRTILLQDGQAYFHGGGGIVADSAPADEYEETLHKVRALVRVLDGKMEGYDESKHYKKN